MKQITVRLKPGQDLRKEIDKIIKEQQIKAGVILSLVGSLNKAVLRMAGAVPGKDEIKTFEGPFEIVSVTGTVGMNDCHIHIAVSSKDGLAFGGHLKEGCIVRVTAEVVLLVFDDIEYKRQYNDKTGYDELLVE
ncbi:MAG: DNA-binding protein [Candidatus Doudnabacteria bacterium]|nr:DNA-binding protein [Candidatus Doudnabacteria bacterium]